MSVGLVTLQGQSDSKYHSNEDLDLILWSTDEESQNSKSYKYYFKVRQEIQETWERVNKAVREYEELDSGRDQIEQIQYEVQAQIDEILTRYEQTQGFRDKMYEKFQSFCDFENNFSGEMEDDVFQTSEVLQAVTTDMGGHVSGQLQLNLTTLSTSHDLVVEALRASIRGEQDQVEKYQTAYEKASSSKDSRYEELLKLYTDEALTHMKDSDNQSLLKENVDGLQALTEHYKHLREDDKEKIGNLSEELKKKDNRITDLQRQLAQMTGEAKKSRVPKKSFAGVYNGSEVAVSPRQTRERRKISSITAPNFSENTVTAVPRRKISQTSNPRLPTRYDSRGGDNRRRKISNQLTVELDGFREMSAEMETSKSKQDKGKREKNKKVPVDDTEKEKTKPSNVEQLTRNIQSYLGRAKEAFGTSQQQLTAVNQIGIRKIKQTKVSIQDHYGRLWSCINRNVNDILKFQLPVAVEEKIKYLLDSANPSSGAIFETLKNKSSDSAEAIQAFTTNLNGVLSDLLKEVKTALECVSSRKQTLKGKKLLQSMKEETKHSMNTINHDVKRLKDHCDQQKIRKIQLKKEIAQKSKETIGLIRNQLDVLGTVRVGKASDENNILKDLMKLEAMLSLEPDNEDHFKLMQLDFDSFRRKVRKYFAKVESVQSISSPWSKRAYANLNRDKVSPRPNSSAGHVSHHPEKKVLNTDLPEENHPLEDSNISYPLNTHSLDPRQSITVKKLNKVQKDHLDPSPSMSLQVTGKQSKAEKITVKQNSKRVLLPPSQAIINKEVKEQNEAYLRALRNSHKLSSPSTVGLNSFSVPVPEWYTRHNNSATSSYEDADTDLDMVCTAVQYTNQRPSPLKPLLRDFRHLIRENGTIQNLPGLQGPVRRNACTDELCIQGESSSTAKVELRKQMNEQLRKIDSRLYLKLYSSQAHPISDRSSRRVEFQNADIVYPTSDHTNCYMSKSSIPIQHQETFWRENRKIVNSKSCLDSAGSRRFQYPLIIWSESNKFMNIMKRQFPLPYSTIADHETKKNEKHFTTQTPIAMKKLLCPAYYQQFHDHQFHKDESINLQVDGKGLNVN